jgi:hypothetical protein
MRRGPSDENVSVSFAALNGIREWDRVLVWQQRCKRLLRASDRESVRSVRIEN